MIKANRLLLAIVFLLFFSTVAFSEWGDVGAELDLGYSSPNKGLLGARVSPMPWSFGLILGSFANYNDFALAYSYHFTNRTGFYAFQSHHYLKSQVGNIWEINTGGGYQDVWIKHLLGYVELGIPIYIGGYRVFRHYRGGIPSNRLKNGDLALVEFRAGFGIGYWFDF
jgi:hypothetical protein